MKPAPRSDRGHVSALPSAKVQEPHCIKLCTQISFTVKGTSIAHLPVDVPNYGEGDTLKACCWFQSVFYKKLGLLEQDLDTKALVSALVNIENIKLWTFFYL